MGRKERGADTGGELQIGYVSLGKTYLKARLRLKDFAFRIERRGVVPEHRGGAVPLSEATSKLNTVDMGIYSIAKEFFDWTEVTGTQGKE